MTTIKLGQHYYKQTSLLFVNNLCADVILGHDILKDHSSLELQLGGSKERLKICNMMAATVPPISIFSNLASNIRPIAIKSRHSDDNQKLISD